jgi:hypothetical protein
MSDKVLLGPNGVPIKLGMFENKKADPPKTGHAFGNWAGRDLTFATLPGGGVVQFDLSKLTVGDFRNMRDHYQINVSLAVLAFMQHQSTFHVECDDKRIADYCDVQLHSNWTMLNRAMSQSNWAGYSPSALEWENNLTTRSMDLVKIMDLVPEECWVNWKLEEGWAPPGRTPPKFKTFDGVWQFGSGWPIPVGSCFWYPLLMEAGDYTGRKLLRPAFQSWFFSILMHLFANRYYERFGEPTPIGRAPFENEGAPDGSSTTASEWMLNVLQQLRNRSVVVLPNDQLANDTNGRAQFEYSIDYLESQMRGADFERYLTRLDEEMSIGLFTPILLLRTADVGSYNLGVQHQQTYSLMIDALNDDRKLYIDNYILSPLVDFNFSPNAPRAKIVFTKLGNNNAAMLRDIVVELIKNGKVKPSTDELGEALGMTLKEIRQTVAPPPTPAPNADPNAAPATEPNPPNQSSAPKQRAIIKTRPMSQARATSAEISTRVRGQVSNALINGRFGEGLRVNIGFKNRFERALNADGIANSVEATNRVYTRIDNVLAEIVKLGPDEFPTADSFMSLFNQVLTNEIDRLA